MPFGLKNAGATFVRAVRTVMRPIQAFCDTYVDDMGVGSSDWKAHLWHNREFLSIMRCTGMTHNLAKCEFGKSELIFVGRVVGSGTHRADPQRLEGIAGMEPPRTKKQLRKLLGAFGYYREYIPHFAEIAKRLTDLTHQMYLTILCLVGLLIVRQHLSVCELDWFRAMCFAYPLWGNPSLYTQMQEGEL